MNIMKVEVKEINQNRARSSLMMIGGLSKGSKSLMEVTVVKSCAVKILAFLALAGMLASGAGASRPFQSGAEGLIDEVVAIAEVPDHLRGIMPEVVVEAEGPRMVLDEVVVVAEAPEHLRGVMPVVEAIAEAPDYRPGLMLRVAAGGGAAISLHVVLAGGGASDGGVN